MDLVLSVGQVQCSLPSSWFLFCFIQKQGLANMNILIFSGARKHHFLVSWPGELPFPWHSKLPHWHPPRVTVSPHPAALVPSPPNAQHHYGKRWSSVSSWCEAWAFGSTNVERRSLGGTWVAQSVEWSTLDFSSGLEFRVVNLSTMVGAYLEREREIPGETGSNPLSQAPGGLIGSGRDPGGPGIEFHIEIPARSLPFPLPMSLPGCLHVSWINKIFFKLFFLKTIGTCVCLWKRPSFSIGEEKCSINSDMNFNSQPNFQPPPMDKYLSWGKAGVEAQLKFHPLYSTCFSTSVRGGLMREWTRVWIYRSH